MASTMDAASSPMDAAEIVSSISNFLAPMWVELSFLLFFLLGFAFLRLDLLTRPTKARKIKGFDEPPPIKPFDPRLKKTIEAEATSGSPDAILKAWRAGKKDAATPLDVLKLVVQALLDVAPDSLVAEITENVVLHSAAMSNNETACCVLDVIARSGRVAVMVGFWEEIQKTWRVHSTYQIYEVLLAGFAGVGDAEKVKEITALISHNRMKLTPRGFSLTIKGFLKNGMVDAVLKQMTDMKKQSFSIPPFAVAQFVRISCHSNRAQEIFDSLVEVGVAMPAEAIALFLEDSLKRNEGSFARRVERLSREMKLPFLTNSYDAMLKLYTVSGDLKALELFAEMQASSVRISEGLCVGLLARCADTKFLRFAEEIAKFTRARSGMTIAVYSSLMKVYAYCGLYEKACDLYDQIRADGLEPDAMMYGCLMKFAVECGRTDLSRALSEKAPCLDIQNYMSLIRAAGRDRDVGRAFAVLEKLKNTGVSLDVAAYNCVLDVCVSTGDMARARQLIGEMKDFCKLDIITYNTLLKGYCNTGDLQGAKALLKEMEASGLSPNDVSYNCMINAAVSTGNGSNFKEAWETIEMMEKSGVAVDHYTISIMMKALKRANNASNVSQALALLDRTGIDVCSDEILLNTILETCIRHREFRRLEGILDRYAQSTMRPSVHTYGSLIKAASTLKRLDRSWEFWKEMLETRAMEPNAIVLGCMLDALVTNQQIEDAVILLKEWKVRVPPNTVIYSTIVKGFANTHQADRAMTMWREMREEGVKMNTVVYNAVIDSQARIGAMESVSELVETMAQDGCTPDGISYSTIVKGYCVKGDLDKAFEVFRGMQKNKMAGDSIVYNTILDGCIRHSRMDLADTLLEDMEQFGVIPTNFTLGILVKMYGRRRQLDKAFEVISTLPKKHGFVANAQVKTCLMCACMNNNSLDRAFEVFEELKQHGQSADAKAYGALISGCVRHGDLQRATHLVEEAYGLGSSAKDKDEPTRRYARGNDGHPLDAEPLEQLLRAFSQQGMMEEKGVPLLDKLRSAKAPVNGRVFTSMLGEGGQQQHNNRGRGPQPRYQQQTQGNHRASAPWNRR